MLAAVPTIPVAVLPIAAVAGAVLAVADAAIRFRRPASGALIAVVELVLGLLLLVATFRPVQPFVSTTIPVLYLTVPLEVVLLVLLLLRSARGGLRWLTAAAVVVNGATAVLTVVRPG
ncbi:hypothetical protein QDR37_07750 [Amnibacterium sp. CER49]|uniref:hypothetical protein n=1 Tax=Amnibacterium sp. CER49 TaxID=3039161 RepID=UPI0024476DD6|nr:hypothetical protein [Amnibacterium sp. CER49]MDH2443832.1 hypothetical protein [Amnibacterium sp. CER49]